MFEETLQHSLMTQPTRFILLLRDIWYYMNFCVCVSVSFVHREHRVVYSFYDSLLIFWTRCFICAALSHYFQHYHHQTVLRPATPRPVVNNAPAIEHWKINQPMSMLLKTCYINQPKTVVNSAATCFKACENARGGTGVQGVNLYPAHSLSLSLSSLSLWAIQRIYYAFFIWQFFCELHFK